MLAITAAFIEPFVKAIGAHRLHLAEKQTDIR
jgi:hypothetical protein